jgi:hypothetical protein
MMLDKTKQSLHHKVSGMRLDISLNLMLESMYSGIVMYDIL